MPTLEIKPPETRLKVNNVLTPLALERCLMWCSSNPKRTSTTSKINMSWGKRLFPPMRPEDLLETISNIIKNKPPREKKLVLSSKTKQVQILAKGSLMQSTTNTYLPSSRKIRILVTVNPLMLLLTRTTSADRKRGSALEAKIDLRIRVTNRIGIKSLEAKVS